MKNRSKLILIYALLLTGCVTSFSMLDKELPSLRTLDDAIAWLGYPTRQYQVAGKDVYEWSTSSTLVMPEINTANTTGYIGRSSVNVTTSSTTYSTNQMFCVLRAVAQGKKLIEWNYDGNNGACYRYANQLKPLMSKSNAQSYAQQQFEAQETNTLGKIAPPPGFEAKPIPSNMKQGGWQYFAKNTTSDVSYAAVLVNSENVTDFKTYADARMAAHASNNGVERTTPLKKLQIAGFDAYSYELTGTDSGSKFTYVVTFVNTAVGILRVTAWTTAANFSNQKKQMYQIAQYMTEKMMINAVGFK